MRNLLKSLTLFCLFPLFFSVSCSNGAKNTPTPIPKNQAIHQNEPQYSEDFYDPPMANEATSPSSKNFWNTDRVNVSKVRKDKKLIAFTFDDAPGKTLERILAVFSSYNENNPDCPASATLFCNGIRITSEAKPLLHAALALGFELGNHTYSHPDLSRLSTAQMQKEIQRNDEILYTIDQKPVHLFRAPFGNTNTQLKSLLSSPLINWTIDTRDWTNPSPTIIYQTVMSNKFSGAIVLMHDGYEATMYALKRLLPDLKAQNYQVVSVSQMIKMHHCHFKNGVEYIRARQRN